MTLSSNPNSENDITEEAAFAWPTVVCVVVTKDPGDWLEPCLKSIAVQDYPDLTTLVVDVGSHEDTAERVMKSAPKAFVKKTEEDNFAHAVNEAINSIEGATYILICHDDVVISKTCISTLVEEAFRSNASIIGPKIIDGENKDKLLEVGGMIDRFGVPFSGIEPDEVDQGQHDGVRDVFFVSSAAMLVRADLFRALNGFDEQCFPGAEDIDLAWRAHLVGARVLVQPEAVVAHHKASDRQRKARTSAVARVAKHRMRMVLKNASKTSLLWILPLAFVLHTFEGIAWLIRLDPRRAWLLFSGWIWNIKNIKDTKKQRAIVQKTREVSDRSIATYQIGGSARIRRFFTNVIQNRNLKKLTNASRTFALSSYSKRTRETPFYLAAGLIYLISVRNIIFNSLTTVGQFARWPSFSNQLNALLYGSSPTSGEPMLSSTFGRIIAATMTFMFGMKAGLAQSIFVLSLIPIGTYGVRLILKDRAIDPRAIAAGVISYGFFTFSVATFSNGYLGSLILMAGLPYLIRALSNYKPRQAGVVLGLMCAFYSAAIVLSAIIAIVYLLLSFTEMKQNSSFTKRFRTILWAGVIALFLNIGLVYDLIRKIDRNAFGLNSVSEAFPKYIFISTPVTVAIYIAVFATAIALLVGRNERTSDLRLLILSASILIAISMVAIRLAQPIFDVNIIFVILQLCVSISIAISINSFLEELKLRSFSIMHIGSVLACALVLASLLISSPILLNGYFSLPQRSWDKQIETVANERIVYFGNSTVIPGRSVLAPLNRNFSISSTPQVTLSSSFVGPASKLDDDIRKIFSSVMISETTHAGYLLGRHSVRLIAIPTSKSPQSSLTGKDSQLLRALDRQVDLVRLRDRKGLVVYYNTALEKKLSSYEYVKSYSPVKTFNLKVRDEKSLFVKNKIDISPITLAIIFANIAILIFVLLWPRRHQLISASSLKITQIVNASNREKSSIDLNSEHNKEKSIIDITERDIDRVTVSKP
ncbi:MAG: glycosyltransferase family 2 protein [Acidimicrobiia bacterium]